MAENAAYVNDRGISRIRRHSSQKASLIERTLFYVELIPFTTCWIHMSALRTGYGQVTYKGKQYPAHRVTYEHFKGPVPQGLDLDHLCRVRSCVNPDHLEPTTRRENILRGATVPAHNKQKQFCSRGHDLAVASIYSRNGHPYRVCRICANIRLRATKQRAKERKQLAKMVN